MGYKTPPIPLYTPNRTEGGAENVVFFNIDIYIYIYIYPESAGSRPFVTRVVIVRAPARAVSTAVISNKCTFLRGKCGSFLVLIRLLAGTLIVPTVDMYPYQ